MIIYKRGSNLTSFKAIDEYKEVSDILDNININVPKSIIKVLDTSRCIADLDIIQQYIIDTLQLNDFVTLCPITIYSIEQRKIVSKGVAHCYSSHKHIVLFENDISPIFLHEFCHYLERHRHDSKELLDINEGHSNTFAKLEHELLVKFGYINDTDWFDYDDYYKLKKCV